MKGKYAAKAALRREDAGVRSEIDSYQHSVRRLTAENKELKDKLAALRKEFRDETRRLRAERDEGLSPETSALRKELQRHRERADAAIAHDRETRKKIGRLLEFTTTLLHDLTGCTGLEANEKMLSLLGDGTRYIADDSTGAKVTSLVSSGDEAEAAPKILTLQQKRGWRSSQKIRDHLDAICEQAARRTRQSAPRRAQ